MSIKYVWQYNYKAIYYLIYLMIMHLLKKILDYFSLTCLYVLKCVCWCVCGMCVQYVYSNIAQPSTFFYILTLHKISFQNLQFPSWLFFFLAADLHMKLVFIFFCAYLTLFPCVTLMQREGNHHVCSNIKAITYFIIF